MIGRIFGVYRNRLPGVIVHRSIGGIDRIIDVKKRAHRHLKAARPWESKNEKFNAFYLFPALYRSG
jgi:hypothetical protein